jgi:hypothetical protein
MGGIRKMNPKIAVVPPKVALQRWMRALLLTISALGMASELAMAEDARDVLSASLSAFAGQPIAIDSVTPSPAPGISEVQITNEKSEVNKKY